MAEETSVLLRTPLYDEHLKLGAKMVPFAGFEMPVQYSGVKDEHQCVRENLGIFDVSHMGEFVVSGPESVDFLQKVTSNDVSKLVDGKVQYSCMPNGKGGIVDDLLVYRVNGEKFILVVNASNMEKDWNWLSQNNTFNCELSDKSEAFALMAVQGPKTAKALQSLTSVDLEGMKYYTFEVGDFAGVQGVMISATGYTGAGGFELYVRNDDAPQVWQAVMEAGKEHGIQPCGLAARDTLRLEMGFCLYGNDIDDSTSPIEAGLGWITKFTKDFIDHDLLKQQKEEGTTRKLVGFELVDRGIPRQGYDIVDADGNKIGHVTSGTMSPSTGKAIGMGYVATEQAKTENSVYIAIRNKQIEAKIVRPPFYKA